MAFDYACIPTRSFIKCRPKELHTCKGLQRRVTILWREETRGMTYLGLTAGFITDMRLLLLLLFLMQCTEQAQPSMPDFVHRAG